MISGIADCNDVAMSLPRHVETSLDGESDPSSSLQAISETAVSRLLASGEAIVLECIARGGGATRWYRVRSGEQLPTLAVRLRADERRRQ
jgi:hypothetical protein